MDMSIIFDTLAEEFVEIVRAAARGYTARFEELAGQIRETGGRLRRIAPVELRFITR